MFEAMKKAAENNPKFKAQLDAAVVANETKRKEEAEAKRLRAAAEYRAKMEREAREAQEKERKRREQEISILSNPRMYPFGYSYQDSGPYSVTYGIIFALTSVDAHEAVVNKIKKDYESDTRYKNQYDQEYHKHALKSVRVWQLDLFDGMCGIGGYME